MAYYSVPAIVPAKPLDLAELAIHPVYVVEGRGLVRLSLYMIV